MVKYLEVLLVFRYTIFLVSGQSTPNPDCNYQQDVIPGQTYYVYSPNYPNSYTANRYCSWSARAPTGYIMNITCNVELPYNPTCPNDRLLVSLTGNTKDSHSYCGSGTFSLQSQANLMLIQLIVPRYTTGGRFYCTLFAPTKPTPPPSCECGWKKESRIVNGQETGINEYPMMVGIVDNLIRALVCGGTIISNRCVLTAAHCLVNKLPENVGLLIGDHNISSPNETNTAKLLRAQSFIGHPNYDTATQVNDIALIFVADYIYYSPEVGPACLPFRYPDSPYVGQVVTVLGWGTTEQAGPKSEVLMKTQLDVVNNTNCQRTFGDKISDNQICTFRSGTDACQADSGGPVIYEAQENRVWLDGVVSYGKGCAIQYPGVNTRVGHYLQWILQSTPGETYCVR